MPSIELSGTEKKANDRVKYENKLPKIWTEKVSQLNIKQSAKLLGTQLLAHWPDYQNEKVPMIITSCFLKIKTTKIAEKQESDKNFFSQGIFLQKTIRERVWIHDFCRPQFENYLYGKRAKTIPRKWYINKVKCANDSVVLFK